MNKFLIHLDERIRALQETMPQVQAQLCEIGGAIRELESMRNFILKNREALMAVGENAGEGAVKAAETKKEEAEQQAADVQAAPAEGQTKE